MALHKELVIFLMLGFSTCVLGGLTISGSTQLHEGEDLQLECSSDIDEGKVDWSHNGMPITNGDRHTLTETGSDPKVTTLIVSNVEVRDGGNYECRSESSYFDVDDVRVEVTPAAEVGDVSIHIVEPDEESINIHSGETLILKCVGSSSTSPMWEHNGMALSPTTVGGRIIITDSVDIHTGEKVSILSRQDMTNAESGRYTCGDRNDYFNTADIQVQVDSQGDQAAVDIFEPSESKVRFLPDHQLTLKCKADSSTELAWLKDGEPIVDESNGFIVNEGTDAEGKMLLLTKQQAQAEDSGVYTCHSITNNANADQVSVTVQEQQDDEDDDDGLSFSDIFGGGASHLTLSSVLLVAMATIAIIIKA